MLPRIVVLFLLAPLAAHADVPGLMALQGALRNGAGGPAPDGTYGITVRLVSAETGGTVLHEEAFGANKAVVVEDGVFQVTLGSATALPPTLFQDEPTVWVEVQVELEPPLPRHRVLTTAYAFAARYAATAGALAGPAKDLACTGCVAPGELSFATVSPSELAAAVAGVEAKLSGYATTTALASAVAGMDAKLGDYATAGDLAAYLPLAGGDLTGSLGLSYHELREFRVHNAAAPPIACDAEHAGTLYFDTVKLAFFGCNGQKYVDFAPKALPGSTDLPAKSCKEIVESGGSHGDGEYWLNPDGNVPFLATCDMTTAGGGWTRGFSIAFPGSACSMTSAANGNPKNAGDTCAKYSDAMLNALATEKIFYSRVGTHAPLFTKYTGALSISGAPGKVISLEDYGAIVGATASYTPTYGSWLLFHQHNWYSGDCCLGSQAESPRLSLEYLGGSSPKYACQHLCTSGSSCTCGTTINTGSAEVYLK